MEGGAPSPSSSSSSPSGRCCEESKEKAGSGPPDSLGLAVAGPRCSGDASLSSSVTCVNGGGGGGRLTVVPVEVHATWPAGQLESGDSGQRDAVATGEEGYPSEGRGDGGPGSLGPLRPAPASATATQRTTTKTGATSKTEKGGKGTVIGEDAGTSKGESGGGQGRAGVKDAQGGQTTGRKTRAISAGQGSLPGAWKTGVRRVSSGGREGTKVGGFNVGGGKGRGDR